MHLFDMNTNNYIYLYLRIQHYFYVATYLFPEATSTTDSVLGQQTGRNRKHKKRKENNKRRQCRARVTEFTPLLILMAFLHGR